MKQNINWITYFCFYRNRKDTNFFHRHNFGRILFKIMIMIMILCLLSIIGKLIGLLIPKLNCNEILQCSLNGFAELFIISLYGILYLGFYSPLFSYLYVSKNGDYSFLSKNIILIIICLLFNSLFITQI